MNGAEAWKQMHGSVSDIPFERPKDVVSLPLEDGPNTSLVTLYVELASTAPNVVAVRLESELLGTRELIATAAIPPGFAGIAAIATGIVADGWHASAHGVLRQAALTCKLGARPCCSGHRVVVPAALTTRLTPRLKTTVPTAHLPLNRTEGSYNAVVGAAGSLPIAATERVTRIVAISDPAGAGGSLSGLGMAILNWPAGQAVEFRPNGNAEGPRTLTFAGTTYYQVELVN